MCCKEKKGRGKEEKKEKKGKKNWGSNRKNKKEARAHLFPLRSRHFWINQKYAIHYIYFVFMQEFFDEQIM